MVVCFAMCHQSTERSELLAALLALEMACHLMRDKRVLVVEFTVTVVAPDVLLFNLLLLTAHFFLNGLSCPAKLPTIPFQSPFKACDWTTVSEGKPWIPCEGETTPITTVFSSHHLRLGFGIMHEVESLFSVIPLVQIHHTRFAV